MPRPKLSAVDSKAVAIGALLPWMLRAVVIGLLVLAALVALLVGPWSEARPGLIGWTVLAGVAVALMAVGEVLARRMARHRQRLTDQAFELERVALVAELTCNAVVISDRQGRIEWVNDGFIRMSGYPWHEAIGQRCGDLLHFEQTDSQARAALADALVAGQSASADVLQRDKAGRPYWVHVDLQPLRGRGGEVNGFVSIATDISARMLERERLRAQWRALPAGVVIHAADGRIVDANPAASRMLGITHDQLLGRDTMDPRWHAVRDDGSRMPGHEHPAVVTLATGQAQRQALMGVSLPSGERRWLRVNAEPLRTLDDRLDGVVTSFLDITEFSAQRRLLAMTVQAAELGTWDWQIDSGAVQFNDQWWRMFGYTPGELPDGLSTWWSQVNPEDRPAARAAMNRHFADQSQPYRCEFRMRCRDGGWLWVMAAGAVVERDGEGRPRRMVGVHMDIDHRKQLEHKLESAALTDALTGLPNREALHRRLSRCVESWGSRKGQVFAVLFMDFDRFKLVNDSLGHEAGDELLRQVAGRLRAALRSGDDVARLEETPCTAARLGGDEFVVLLERLRHADDASMVAERLLGALSQPYLIDGQVVETSVSIGLVTSDSPGREPATLIRDADTAMYEAKRLGRGRVVVFSPEMHERVCHTMSVERDLRQALVEQGQLWVAYQPIVELGSRRMVGVEALARWNHPDRGEVSPMEFIAVAEESGLIEELGAWVLRQACKDTAALLRRMPDDITWTVAVNLSRAQILKDSLPELVARTLSDTGLPAERLHLEITESMAMQDAGAVGTLTALRRTGVRLALDDFGTGYSSLASLDQLPLDAIKIDRSFVARMSSNAYQTALVEATLRVANSLRLDVVAEGIEDEMQAATLHALGCPLGQGWHFGKPMTAERLSALLQAEVQAPKGRLEPELALIDA
jgi:diguanylate cyclase (GGDEF)-like protein/PAS domain S-box-containing protein